VFDSRSEAFGGDDVLQENIIVSAEVGRDGRDPVLVTSSSGTPGDDELRRVVEYDQVVPPSRSVPFIHLITDGSSDLVARQMRHFDSSLAESGVEVSTGRVVDFRARRLLRMDAAPSDFPLIYPTHLRNGRTVWPGEDVRKPCALANLDGVDKLLVPPGTYVLIKRFSSKEQRRRVEAAIYDSEVVAPGSPVGFENHVNYIHADNEGLPRELATGLAVYLNSSLVDLYFRLFSGHTQVNATDLRSFPFPTRGELERLGRVAATAELDQSSVDELIRTELLSMTDSTASRDPVAQIEKVLEARRLLRELGFPPPQTNHRSALVLLALLGLEPEESWATCSSPALGITELMSWFAEHYGKTYAPNTRETVRRQTVHQFLDAGLVVQNPDDPSRPVNSGRNVYQLIPEAVQAIRAWGTVEWDGAKASFLGRVESLRERYAQAREMERIPVVIAGGAELSLSPGGQNVLVKSIIEEFLPRFAPDSRLLYVGDTEDKWAHADLDAIAALGVEFDPHGKFPDVVVHYTSKNWLLLVEAVTSHGPVNPKRHGELKRLFGESSAGLVFVTAFLTRKDFSRYMSEIAWETEVWIAESPAHMIHFDGQRFLGPYSE
jgi:adenine-specific DNA-methyltransferase